MILFMYIRLFTILNPHLDHISKALCTFWSDF